MQFTIELTEVEEKKLEEAANRYGIKSQDLMRIRVLDVFSAPDADFQTAAEYVVKKNKELYKRLS